MLLFTFFCIFTFLKIKLPSYALFTSGDKGSPIIISDVMPPTTVSSVFNSVDSMYIAEVSLNTFVLIVDLLG